MACSGVITLDDECAFVSDCLRTWFHCVMESNCGSADMIRGYVAYCVQDMGCSFAQCGLEEYAEEEEGYAPPTTALVNTSLPITSTATPTPEPFSCTPDMGLQVMIGATGFAGRAASVWTGGSAGNASRPILARPAAPGAQGSLGLSIPGSVLSLPSFDGPQWAVLLPPVATVSVILRTPVLYRDFANEYQSLCRMALSYQVQDSEGRLPVRIDGTSAWLHLQLLGSDGVSVVARWGPLQCDQPSADSFAGTCTISACDDTLRSWFRLTDDVAAMGVLEVRDQYVGHNVTAPTVPLILSGIPQYSLSGAPGMKIQFPVPNMPRFPGETFEFSIYANTGGYGLKIWGVQINYNVSVLEWVQGSFVVSALYSPPLLVTDVPGVLIASVSKAPSTLDSEVMSTNLWLANVTFIVPTNALAGLWQGAISCEIIGMLNSGGNQYVTNKAAQILDLQGGYVQSGTIAIEQSMPIGIYAYADASELVNWEALGGQVSSATVRASAVYNRFGVSDAEISASCSIANPNIVFTDCNNIGSTTLGQISGLIRVVVTYGTLWTAVALRVWSPQTVTVYVLDNILNRIAGSEQCGSLVYQRTLCSVMANFTTGEESAVAVVDVTDVVTISTSNPAVVSIAVLPTSSVLARGLNAGTALLSVAGASIPVVPAQITVVDDAVDVLGLSVTLLSRVVWGPFPSTVETDDVTLFLSHSSVLSERLTRAAPVAQLFVTAHFSDGESYLVTQNDGVNMTTANSKILNIASAIDSWTGQRVVTGELSQCGPLALASWSLCHTTIASGSGIIDIELPAPLTATMTVSNSYITAVNDLWALPPRSFPTSSSLTEFAVTFDDGSTIIFPPNSETVLHVAEGSTLVSLQGFTIKSTGVGSGVVTLTASVLGMGNVSASCKVYVITDAAIAANLGCNYVSCDNVIITSPTDAATLQPFNFPSTFSSFTVMVNFVDGSQVDYTTDNRWQLAVAEGGGLAVVSGKLLKSTGSGVGRVGLQARFAAMNLNSSVAHLNVVLSAAVSASISCVGVVCENAKLSPASDPASSPPISYPSRLSFQVTVSLVNKVAVLLPYDRRTSYQIHAIAVQYVMEGNTILINGTASSTSVISIWASFPGTFNFTTQPVTISIVVLSSLGIRLTHSSGGQGNSSILQRIHCSVQYQASDISVFATLTDNTARDVTAYSFLSSSNSTRLYLSGTRAIGLSPGVAQVLAAFTGIHAMATVYVSSVSLVVSSVTLQGLSSSFEDEVGSTRLLSLNLLFEDGSALTLNQQTSTWSWIVPGSLLGALAFFTSDFPSAVSVGAPTGIAQLNENWYTEVTVTVDIKACGSALFDSASLVTSPNVIPYTDSRGDGDVDIGNVEGLPVNPVAVGSTATLPIFMRSDAALKSFEVLLFADSLVDVVGCTAGSDWTGGFACSTNDPVGTIFIVGADVTSTLTGQRIHIADVQVLARRSGITRISGVRVKVSSPLSSNLCPQCPIVAGNISFVISGSGARRFSLSENYDAQNENLFARHERSTDHIYFRVAESFTRNARRTLLQSTALVYGDVNGDGVFDTADCLMTEEYFTNIRLGNDRTIGCPVNGGDGCRLASSLTEWQLKQMDQVSDPKAPVSVPDYSDFNLMLQIYSNNQRFFADWNYTNDQVAGLVVNVLLLDSVSQPAVENCGVRFILATTRNMNLLFFTNSSLTSEGILVVGRELGQGWYGIQSRSPLAFTEDIPFVFMIETVDGNGQSSAERRFPFYSTDLPPYNLFYSGFKPFNILRFLPVTTQAIAAPSTLAIHNTTSSARINVSAQAISLTTTEINQSRTHISSSVQSFFSTPSPFSPSAVIGNKSSFVAPTNATVVSVNFSAHRTVVSINFSTYSTTSASSQFNFQQSNSTSWSTGSIKNMNSTAAAFSTTTAPFISSPFLKTSSGIPQKTSYRITSSALNTFNISELPPVSSVQSVQVGQDQLTVVWSYPSVDSIDFDLMMSQCQDICNVSIMKTITNGSICTFSGSSFWKCTFIVRDLQISRYLLTLFAFNQQNGVQSQVFSTIVSITSYPDTPIPLRLEQFGTAILSTSALYFSWYLNDTTQIDETYLEVACQPRQSNLSSLSNLSYTYNVDGTQTEHYFYAQWEQNGIALITPQSGGYSLACMEGSFISFRLRAQIGSLMGNWSSVLELRLVAFPGAVKGLTALVNDDEVLILLGWFPPGDMGSGPGYFEPLSYKIDVSLCVGFDLIGSCQTTSVQFVGNGSGWQQYQLSSEQLTVQGTSYYIRVFSRNYIGISMPAGLGPIPFMIPFQVLFPTDDVRIAMTYDLTAVSDIWVGSLRQSSLYIKLNGCSSATLLAAAVQVVDSAPLSTVPVRLGIISQQTTSRMVSINLTSKMSCLQLSSRAGSSCTSYLIIQADSTTSKLVSIPIIFFLYPPSYVLSLFPSVVSVLGSSVVVLTVAEPVGPFTRIGAAQEGISGSQNVRISISSSYNSSGYLVSSSVSQSAAQSSVTAAPFSSPCVVYEVQFTSSPSPCGICSAFLVLFCGIAKLPIQDVSGDSVLQLSYSGPRISSILPSAGVINLMSVKVTATVVGILPSESPVRSITAFTLNAVDFADVTLSMLDASSLQIIAQTPLLQDVGNLNVSLQLDSTTTLSYLWESLPPASPKILLSSLTLNGMHQSWIPSGAANISAALTVINIPYGFSVDSVFVGVGPPNLTLASTADFRVVNTTIFVTCLLFPVYSISASYETVQALSVWLLSGDSMPIEVSILDDGSPASVIVKDSQALFSQPQISTLAPTEGPIEGGTIIVIGIVGGTFSSGSSCSLIFQQSYPVTMLSYYISLDDWLAQDAAFDSVVGETGLWSRLSVVSDSLARGYNNVVQTLIDSRASLSSLGLPNSTFSILLVNVSDLRDYVNAPFQKSSALVVCSCLDGSAVSFNFSLVQVQGPPIVDQVITDLSTPRSALQGGSRMFCTIKNFIIVYSPSDVLVSFGNFRVDVDRVLNSDSVSTTFWLIIPPSSVAAQILVHVASASSVSQVTDFNFTYFDPSRTPVVSSFSPYQVYTSGGESVTVCLIHFDVVLSDMILVSIESNLQQVQVNASFVPSTTAGQTCVAYVSPKFTAGVCFVTISSAGMSSNAFQLLYVTDPSGPPIIASVRPALSIGCSVGLEIQVTLENFRRLESSADLIIQVGAAKNFSQNYSTISTSSVTVVSFWLAMRDAGPVTVLLWSIGREAQTANFTLLCQEVKPIVDYVSPRYAYVKQTVNVQILVINFNTSGKFSIHGNANISVLLTSILEQQDESALLQISVRCYVAGLSQLLLDFGVSVNTKAEFNCIDMDTPVIVDVYPAISFTYGGFPLTIQAENLDIDSQQVMIEFQQEDSNISVVPKSVTVSNINPSNRSSLLVSCIIPASDSPCNATIFLHYGERKLTLPSSLQYLAPISPSIASISPTTASVTSATTILLTLLSFPYPIDAMSSVLAAQFEWPDSSILPATCTIIQSSNSTYLGLLRVQNLDLAITTPVGSLVSESNDVTLRVFHILLQGIGVQYQGFSFFDPSEPVITGISVASGARGIDSVALPASAPSLVSLTVSNLPASYSSPTVALDTLTAQILLASSSLDQQGNPQLSLRVQVYPSGPIKIRYGFVAFAPVGSQCVPSCCANASCQLTCTGKLACFSLQLFDNTLPAIVAIYTDLQGPATGKDIIRLSVSQYPSLATPGNAICTFGSDLFLGNVVIGYSSATATDVMITTPAYPLPSLAVLSVAVTLTTITRPDLSVSFTYEYVPSTPSLVSLNPTQGSSIGGVAVTLVVSNFAYDALSTVLSFGTITIATGNMTITPALDGQQAYVSFTTPSTSPGNVVIALYPASCALPCGITLRGSFSQINDNVVAFIPPVPTATSFQTSQIVFYLHVPPTLLEQPTFEVWSSFQMENWGDSAPTACALGKSGNVVAATAERPSEMLGECRADIFLSIVVNGIINQNLTAVVQFFDGLAPRISSVSPDVLPVTMTVADLQITFESTVSITLLNFPPLAQSNEMQVVFGSGIMGVVTSIESACIGSASACNSSVLTVQTPAHNQPGSVAGTLLAPGFVLTFVLTYAAPCDFDAYCGAQQLYPDVLAIQASAPLACEPALCFSVALVGPATVLSFTPSTANQTGGTEVRVLVVDFPALGAADVTVQVGDGAAQVLVVADSVDLQPGSTSPASRATVRFRTPAVSAGVTDVTVYLSMPFFSTTRTAAFSFQFVPYLTGKVNVTDFQPRAVAAGAPLNLVISIANMAPLPRPFVPATVQLLLGGAAMPATAVLSSDAAETKVSLWLGPAQASIDGSLELAAYGSRRGPASLSEPFMVIVYASLDPVLRSFYPTELQSYQGDAVVRAIVANVQPDAIDSANGSLTSASAAAAASVAINLTSAYALDAGSSAFVVAVPSMPPGLLLVMLLQGGALVANFSVDVVPWDQAAVQLVSPASIAVSAAPPAVSIFLVNFPNPSCGGSGSCFAQTLGLQASCGGRPGGIAGHAERGGQLILTFTPPALLEAATAACAVRGYDASGRGVTAGFQLTYVAAAAASPVDGSTAGGATVAVTVLGFALANVSDPSQLAVSFCGAPAAVVSLAFDPATTRISAVVLAPAGQAAGTCACAVAVARPPRSAAFQFCYYDPPVATATPSTVAQDGLIAGGAAATVTVLVRARRRLPCAARDAVCGGLGGHGDHGT